MSKLPSSSWTDCYRYINFGSKKQKKEPANNLQALLFIAF